MKNPEITLRQKEILQKISRADNYVSISSIAKDLGVSSKTVFRELSELEKWLEQNDFALEKRTGLGVRLKGDKEDKEYLKELLNEEKEVKIYNPQERQTIIIGELLQNQEPVKLFYLSTLLNVTEGTVSHDLDKVEEWLTRYNLKLIRKPGLGVYIEGQEKAIRRAIINYIYENTDENQLFDLVHESMERKSKGHADIEWSANSRLLDLVNRDTIRKLEALILEFENNAGYEFMDNAYIGLLVHLALAIQRIKKNEKIVMDKAFLEQLRKSKEFDLAADLAKKISEAFEIDIHDDEIGYITMHIKGAKTFGNYADGKTIGIGNYELIKLSKQMIKVAEAETGYFFEHNDKLLVGLVNHLGPAITRLKMGMDIRNPLLKEIKKFYSDLFKLAEKCVEVVEKHIGIKMPESEIAYIAMHMGAAMEIKEVSSRQIYRAVVACTTGIGTSGLLASKIEKTYDNIQVIDVISTIHIRESLLKEKDIDLIISTVPIDSSPVPVVMVNPLLFQEDKERIESFIKKIKVEGTNSVVKQKKSLDFRDKLEKIKLYIEGIIQILNNFFLEEDETSESINDVIEKVSFALGDNDDQRQIIKNDLIEREKKGGTVLSGHNIILLHCRTTAVSQLGFGIVRINNKPKYLNSKGEKVNVSLAIIMLAPEGCSKAYIEVISYISRMVIEKANFLKKIKEGSLDEVNVELNILLEEFYKVKSS